MTRRFFVLATVFLVAWGVTGQASVVPEITVGSKKFTESVVLGAIAVEQLRAHGFSVRYRGALGGTQVLWHALLRGEIDVYPEYTGTLTEEILAGRGIGWTVKGLETVLEGFGIGIIGPLGFNNTYAIGMAKAKARALSIRTISDLAAHPALRFGLTNEFMDRADGWPGLRGAYALPQAARGLDHDLAYRGLASGRLDVVDLYSTDAEIRYYDIAVLQDDKQYFREYMAVILYRRDLLERAPGAVAVLEKLTGRITPEAMVSMNAAAKLDKVGELEVAASFLQRTFDLKVAPKVVSLWRALWRHTIEHLILVTISLSAAIAVSIPLGIVAARRRRLGHMILGVVGVLQTIPSLALLVFMIPLLGIGGPPAIVALFLYSLLPIVRNTYTGITGIAGSIIESADALGLTKGARLIKVELPMASPAILAGIKTSAVINVGTATLGALIGAGGYGQPILTGIRLDDIGLILQGAIPAALLALAVQGLFELTERHLVPRGLRL